MDRATPAAGVGAVARNRSGSTAIEQAREDAAVVRAAQPNCDRSARDRGADPAVHRSANIGASSRRSRTGWASWNLVGDQLATIAESGHARGVHGVRVRADRPKRRPWSRRVLGMVADTAAMRAWIMGRICETRFLAEQARAVA
jgi:hypothetical protein